MTITIDSNTILWPTTIPTPSVDRTLTKDPRAWQTQMESNRNRNRPTGDGAMETMAATWNFTAEQYAAFKVFFEDVLIQGQETFVMETLEPDSDSQFARDTFYQMAFYDGTYAWQQDDGYFQVTATLQINAQDYDLVPNPFYSVPLVNDVVTYPSACLEYFQVTWTIDADSYTPGLDVIQTAANLAGPWYDWLAVSATTEELAAKTKVLSINNSFDGNRWFRRTRNGFPTTYPFKPKASIVPTFDLAVVNTVSADFPLLRAGPYPRPLSYIENQWVNPLVMYVEPRGRLQYFVPNFNWDGIRTVVSSPNASNPDGLRWTRDGSDPTEEMVWPPPTADGYNYNARLYVSDFSGCIKARCFDGDCGSPMILYIIDKKHDLIGSVGTNGRGYSAGGATCTLPITDGSGNLVRSGYDCQTKYGGVQGLVDNVIVGACDAIALTPVPDYGPPISQGLPEIYSLSAGYVPYPTILVGTEIWSGYEVGVFRFFMDEFRATYYANSAGKVYWDTVPRLYEISSILSAGDSQLVTVARPDDVAYKNYAGLLGSLDFACGANEPWLFNLRDLVECPNDVQGTRAIDAFALYVTPYENDWTGAAKNPPALPVPPAPPTPIPADEDYQELWDEYVDSTDATIGSYALGSGWDTAWVMNDGVIVEGYDLFDSYTQYADGDATGYALAGGESWFAAENWTTTSVLRDTNSGLDDWESYSTIPDGDIELTIYQLALGTGWAYYDPTHLELGLSAWYGQSLHMGVDDFQSYADGTLTTPDTGLNWDDGFSWYFGADWFGNT